MGEFALAVAVREETGKGQARRLREAGRIPAVLYGHGKHSLALSLDALELEALLKKSDAGINTLIDLEGDQAVSGRIVLVKELQRHPVRGSYVHADLYEIDANETIQVTVPIHLLGTPSGVKLGGILEHTMREIELDCLPRAIPDSIDIDVSALELDESVHVSDLALPEGVNSGASETQMVAHVSIPKVAEEEEAAAAEGEEAEAAGEEKKDEEKAEEKSEGESSD